MLRVDFADSINGFSFLVVDAHSKWLEIFSNEEDKEVTYQITETHQKVSR